MMRCLKKIKRQKCRGRICSRCKGVLKDLEIVDDSQASPEWGKRIVNLSLGSLLESAAKCCYICAAILTELKESTRGFAELDSLEKSLSGQVAYQLHEDHTEGPPILEFDIDLSIQIPPISEPIRVVKLYVLHSESKVSQELGQITSNSTQSKESFKNVQRWMRRCQENHATCRKVLEQNSGSYGYPTRLIDVSIQASLKKVHLCDDFPRSKPRAPYAALSHCWGKADFKCLKTDSYKDFVTGIAIADLALTFRGAIEFTRRLGLQYLWIDSLCIKQDSPDDWQSEAARMRDIYAGSSVTIAATRSGDSDQSLYSQRRPKLLNSPAIDLLQRLTMPGKYSLMDHSSWITEIEHSPLNARGWVLQERLLSPRVVHFGHGQVIWECLETDATETLPLGLLPGRTLMGDTFRLKDFFPGNLDRDTDSRLKSQYAKEWWKHILWGQVIENYSKRQLSYPLDKLIAISGIAKMFSDSFSCRYVAGLWFEDIERQLLWHVDDIPDIEQVYTAPSWSWASVAGQICQPLCWADASIVAKVCTVDVKNVADNEYGIVKERARLEIEGQLRHITLGLPRGLPALESTSRYLDTVDKIDLTGESPGPSSSLDPEVRLDYAGLDQADAFGFYCMPVYYDETVPHLRGLILSSETCEGEYKRVGTFWSFLPENIEVILPKRMARGCGDERDDPDQKTLKQITIV